MAERTRRVRQRTSRAQMIAAACLIPGSQHERSNDSDRRNMTTNDQSSFFICMLRVPRRKPGASSYTRTRFSLP